MASTHRIPQIDYDPLKEYIDIERAVLLTDEDFITNSFMVDLKNLKDEDDDGLSKQAYFKTIADTEFMDTSIGGHIALGMPYAFTRFADIPRKGLLAGRDDFINNKYSLKLGMGRNYAKMFQINSKSRILMLEFGKPKFRSMFSFFSGSIDYGKSMIANEGRSTLWYNIGQGIGMIGAFLVFPGIMIIYLLGKLLNTIIPLTDSRYYSFKPDMHNYLQTANVILTQFQIERGLVKSTFDTSKVSSLEDRYGVPITLDMTYLTEVATYMPDIFSADYGLDIYKIIARPQLIVNKLLKSERKILEDGLSTVPLVANPTLKPFTEVIKKINEGIESFKPNTDKYGRKEVEKKSEPAPLNVKNIDDYKLPDKTTGSKKILPHDKDKWSTDFSKYLDVISNYGMEHISLYVDYTGPTEISFSNEIGDITAKSVINNIGSARRDIKFSLSNAKFFGDTVDEFVKAGRDVMAGTLSGATMGLSDVIMGLIGGGYLQFPKMWKNSSVTLPSHTFKMRLGGPYGNPLSLSLDIDIVSSLLFAGMLPLSTGNASHTSPYLCKAFMRGVLDIDFGMITSMSYKAADGAGRNIYGQPLEVEVSFTITDFSDEATAPVNNGILGVFGGDINDHDVLSKFIRSMGARSYADSRYLSKKVIYRLAQIEKQLNDVQNPAKWATMVGDSIIGDAMKVFHSSNSVTKIFE